jgi:hypothetical protein
VAHATKVLSSGQAFCEGDRALHRVSQGPQPGGGRARGEEGARACAEGGHQRHTQREEQAHVGKGRFEQGLPHSKKVRLG